MVVALPLMSRIELAPSKQKQDLLKKRRENCTFLSTGTFVAKLIDIDMAISSTFLSAGVSGPLVDFFDDPQAPENINVETTGIALFKFQRRRT